jgi:hypothetical protein
VVEFVPLALIPPYSPLMVEWPDGRREALLFAVAICYNQL